VQAKKTAGSDPALTQQELRRTALAASWTVHKQWRSGPGRALGFVERKNDVLALVMLLINGLHTASIRTYNGKVNNTI
jgi:hypothetical protein